MSHPNPQPPCILPRHTNPCAAAGFALSFLPVASIAGFIISIAGFIQCSRTGEKGRGMAIAGILIGSLWIGVMAALLYTFAWDVIDEILWWFYDEGGRYNFITMTIQSFTI